MEQNKLKTFDDDMLDGVAGGASPELSWRSAVKEKVGEVREEVRSDAAKGANGLSIFFGGVSAFFKEVSDGLSKM